MITGTSCLQYEIGNPLTAERMTRHALPAGLYAPLRVILYEDASDRAVFEYDLPSSLFAQFGDERVAEIGRELDSELEAVLEEAGGLRSEPRSQVVTRGGGDRLPTAAAATIRRTSMQRNTSARRSIRS
jgi:uncharacterized protein DUF302